MLGSKTDPDDVSGERANGSQREDARNMLGRMDRATAEDRADDAMLDGELKPLCEGGWGCAPQLHAREIEHGDAFSNERLE